MSTIKVAIVGCGAIANRKHMPAIARHKDVEMVAFCDIIIERAQAAAKSYGAADPLICEDYHDVLARDDIDAVHVCTPNISHAEITIAALKAGKHVLCEKPMAKTAAEAKAMLDAYRESGKLLTIGYQYRYRVDSLLMKKLADSGELGDIYFAKAQALRRRGVPTHGVFTDKEKQGGGPLIDLGTHALDMVMWMINNYEPVTVLGSTFNKIGRIGSQANGFGPWNPDTFEVEDSAFGLVKFRNGATIALETSWALNTIVADQTMALLCGTKAGADMYPPTGPVVRTGDFTGERTYHVRVNGEKNGQLYIQNYALGGSFIGGGDPPEFFPGMYKEQEVWFNSIRTGADLVIKPEQAYVVTQILEAIYRSAETGDVVHLGQEVSVG